MPVYEFICMTCEHRFDRLQPMRAVEPSCPSCDSSTVRRRLSMFATTGGSSAAAGGRGHACACGGACACSR